jgi:hypothetical protein
MYYCRMIPDDFAQIIMQGGALRWLVDYVKTRDDLDLLVGKNNGEKYISVYRGLTKIVTILGTSASDRVRVKTAGTYQKYSPLLVGTKSPSDITKTEIEAIRTSLEKKGLDDRYYGNRKEGYYQNEISRIFGLCSNADSDFLILDKEVVVGYEDETEKTRLFGPLRDEYKGLQKIISERNPKRYGSGLEKKSIGDELDFIAIDKNGDILLMELKHGSNTSGIYLSPLQIGLYYQIFNGLLPKYDLQNALIRIFEQKRSIGLISSDWELPRLSGKIIPILIVAEPNQKNSAFEKFCEVLEICREEKGSDFLRDLRTYAYTSDKKLTLWGRQ